MILIEALNIRAGGGAKLLNYLVQTLIQKGVPFKAIVNAKIKEKINNESILYLNSNLAIKDFLLYKYINLFHPKVVFCFGNIPPIIKYKNAKVVTYFQNTHLLDGGANSGLSFLRKLRYNILMALISIGKKNSNYFLFQSIKNRNSFIERFKIPFKNTKYIPFFNLTQIKKSASGRKPFSKIENSFIYVSSGASHKNHIRLLNAWTILAKRDNFYPKLYLTISEDNNILSEILKKKCDEGLNIINLGVLPQDDLFEYVKATEFTIFPSLAETIGLGLVEGVFLGNKILASDMPYVHEVVIPSLVFNPLQENSIADVVLFACLNKNHIPISKVLLEDKIDELISFLQ